MTAKKDAEIIIGDRCEFSSTVIVARKSVTIGDRVFFCSNCTIIDSDGYPVDAEARSNQETPESLPVVIGDDVWLGANVTVHKGCAIGARTVVTANSIVTHSLPAGVIAGGIPARVIKRIGP